MRHGRAWGRGVKRLGRQGGDGEVSRQGADWEGGVGIRVERDRD